MPTLSDSTNTVIAVPVMDKGIRVVPPVKPLRFETLTRRRAILRAVPWYVAPAERAWATFRHSPRAETWVSETPVGV